MFTKNQLFLFLFLMSGGIIMTGCNKETSYISPYEQYQIDSVIIDQYISENQLDAFDVEYDSLYYGVYCSILEEGTEEPDVNPSIYADITVKYKGYLVDGTVFDETAEGDSVTFYLGGMISGWRIGFTALSKGDKATLLIPSYYGYGTSQIGTVPSNSVLLFDVELLNFTEEVAE